LDGEERGITRDLRDLGEMRKALETFELEGAFPERDLARPEVASRRVRELRAAFDAELGRDRGRAREGRGDERDRGLEIDF